MSTNHAAPNVTLASPSAPAADASLAQHVDECVQLLEKVAAIVADGKPPLTAAQRMNGTKLRKGGEKIAPMVAALATRHGVTFASHPLDSMTAKLALVRTLVPLFHRSQQLLKQIEDVSMRAQAEASNTTSVYYNALRGIARTDGDVEASLAPIEEFFAYRHKSTKKAAKPAATETATAPVEATPTSVK